MNDVILSKDEALKTLGISDGQVLSKDQALKSINNVNWMAAEQKTAANLQNVANTRKQATISPITLTESPASGQKSPSLGVITDVNTYDAVGDRVRAERYAIMQQRQGKTVPAALDALKGTGIAPQVQRIADKGDGVTNADIDMLRDLRAGLVSSLPDNSMTQAEFLQMQRDGTLAAYQTPQSEKDTNAQIDALDDLIKAAKQRAEMSGERPTTTQRIGAGVQAIGSSTAATLPMLGAAAVQAGKDTIQNLSNPKYRAALWERIKKGMDTEAMQRLDEATVSNPVSLDSDGVQKMRESNQSRERMLEGLTPEQRFIGEGLYSVADNATTLPLAAINPSLPLYAMGTKAAAGRTYELTEQGKSAGEALTRGIISGVIEGATEKIPLDSVLDIIKTGGKTLAANMLKQTVIEAGEEGASYLLNYTADKLAKDPNAQFTVQELMHQMALGGFSGLIMSGGGTLANRVANVDMLTGLGKGTTEQDTPSAAIATKQTAPDYNLENLQPQAQPEMLGLPEQATSPTMYADQSGNITRELPNQMPEDVRISAPRNITQTTFDPLLGENVQTGHLDAETINAVLSEAYFAKTSPVTYAKSKVDGIIPQINAALNQVKEAYAGFNGNGVDMVRMFGDTGETGTFKRVSNNPQWYRDLYANGNAPTKVQKIAAAESAFWDDVQKERGEFLPVEVEQAYNQYNAVLNAGNAINDNTIMVTPDGSQALDMDKSPAPVYSPVQGRQMLAAIDGLFEEQAAQQAQRSKQMDSDLDMRQNAGKPATPTNTVENLHQNTPTWNNVDYNDKETQNRITQEIAGEMLSQGDAVSLTEDDLSRMNEYFPDLRSMKKQERTPILKSNILRLKDTLYRFLSENFTGKPLEFNVNGSILEAKLYDTGIREVLDHLTREKAAVIGKTADIFKKARYLYSTQDKAGNSNVYRWNYFFVPVTVGNQNYGVRIAVRDMTDPKESQIYHYGIKKEASLAGAAPEQNLLAAVRSSDASLNTNIAQVANGVNNIISDSNAKNAESKPDMLAMFSGGERSKLHAISPDMLSLLNSQNAVKDYFTPHEGLEGNREYLNAPSLTERIGEGERAFDGIKELLETAKQDRGIRENEAVEQSTANVLTEMPQTPVRETITDTAESAYRKAFDEGYNIGKVAKAVGDDVLYPMFNNAKASHVSAQYMIGSAQTDINGREVGRGLMDIFAPAKAKGKDYFKQFQEYLYHMHNIDRMSLETAGRAVYSEMIDEIAEKYPNITDETQWRKLAAEGNADASQWLKLNANMERLKNKPVFGPKVGARESLDSASGLLAAHPEFEEMAGEVYNYNRNLMKMRIDAGLLSQAQADLFERLYPHYVPAFRKGESSALHEENFRRAQVSSTVKKAIGGSADLLLIDDSMARQTMQVVANANRNLFGVRLLEDALKSRDKVGRNVQSIEDLDMGAQEMEDPANLKNSFMVYLAGKPVKMALSNGMMEGVRAIMPKQTDIDKALKVHLNAVNTFKAAVTGWNPAFLVKNGIRDIQDAGIYSRDYAAMLKNYPRAWQEMRSNGELWRLYLSKGGTGSSVFDYDTGFKDVYKQKNALETTLDKVEQANLMVEQAPRFAEFLGVIDEGGTGYENVQKALLAAADATVNFGRSGSWGKIVNRGIVPFFNPAMQGIDKTARTFINAYRNKDMIRLIGKAALVGVLPQVLDALLYRDDDEYDMISDRDKDNYYLIKIKSGLWVKLPKGRVLSVFGNPAQRALRQLGGEDAGDAWAGVVKTTFENNLPENPLRRNFFTPIFEADLLDSDSPGKTWYKSDIEPQRLRKFAPGERYDESTDAFSKAIGGALDVSPKKINYVMDSYTGVVGDMLLPLMTPKAEKSVFERSFIIDPVLNNKLSEKFYDTYNDAQYAYNSKAVTPGDTAIYKALGAVSSALSDMYSEIRDIENSDAPNKEKQSEVRALREQINSLISNSMDSVEEIRKTADNQFAGIPQEIYYNAMVAVKDVKSDKDKDGNTVSLSASKNKKAAIDQVAQGLTMEQKRKFYKAFNVSEKVW